MAAAAPQLLEALQALYYHEDPNVKTRANAWLVAWQHTTEAWGISDSVLHDVSASLDAQYFCAQTLRDKVQRDFEELPPGAVPSLRDSLLMLLIKFSRGSPPVRTQLCLALAAMAVHVPAAQWVDPAPAGGAAAAGDVVRWFALRFQSVPPDRALPCMLEILTVLPQEAASHKIAVRPERRREFADELKASTPVALDVLSSCLGQPEEQTRQQVLAAFGAWLRLSEGKPLQSASNQAAQHPLVVAALDGLRSTETFHASVDAVCELIWATIDLSTQQQHPAMVPVIQAIVPAVMALRPRFTIASHRLAASRSSCTPGSAQSDLLPPSADGGPGPSTTDDFDDDDDSAKGMARLFVELAEAYLALIATAVPEVQAPVEAMLEVAAFPDHNVYFMCFNFWTRLAKLLVSSCDPAPPDSNGGAAGAGDGGVAAIPLAEAQRRRAAFAPSYERLVTLLRGRTRYADNHEALWDREDRAEFKHVRHEVSDALEGCAVVVGYRGTLVRLAQPLSAAMAAAGSGNGDWDWRSAEAALYCVRAISRCSPEPGLSDLHQLLHALPRLACEPHLMYTSCTLVTAYAPWLGRSLQAGYCQELPAVLLRLAVSGLASTDAAGAAACALVALCEHCSTGSSPPGPNSTEAASASLPLRGSLEELAALYGRAVTAGVMERASGVAPPGLSVSEEDVLKIMQAVCTVSSLSLPRDQLRAAAVQLLQPVLLAVQSAASALPTTVPLPPPPGTRANHNLSHQYPLVSPLLDRLSVVFDYIRDPQTVADILGQSWPVLDMVLSRCGSDERLVEHACRALRHGMKAAGRLAGPIVPMLLQVLPVKYHQTRQSVFLYVTGELAKLFGDDPTHCVTLSGVLCNLLAEACTTLRSLPDLTDHPDLVDDVFLCASRALNYCPHLLLISQPTVEVLLDTALLGVLVQHREACVSTLGFVVAAFDPALLPRLPPAAVSALHAALEPRSAMLLRLLLAGVAGAQPSARLQDLAHGLSAVLRSPLRAGHTGLSETLSLLPDLAVPPSDKAQLLGRASPLTVSSQPSRDDHRRFQAGLDDFAEVCCRTTRTREMAQRALLPPQLYDVVLQPLLPPPPPPPPL